MERYPKAAVERAMKVQEVMLRAIARKITWFQAAEILGITIGICDAGAGVTSRGVLTGCWTAGAVR